MVERDLYSIEAEHGVLGALMHKPELCEEVGAFLSPYDFYYADNDALYSMILTCHSKGVKPDPITLSNVKSELPSEELTIIYASQVMRDVPSAANAIPYAKIVLERSTARKLHEKAMQISEIAQSSGKITDQIAQAQELIMSLNLNEETPDFNTLGDLAVGLMERINDVRNGTADMGLDFGLPDLDRIIRGIRKKHLIIIAGRPGTGKTVLGLGLAERAAIVHNKKCLFFSLEMGGVDLAQRTLASISGVSQERLETGRAFDCDESAPKIFAASAKMKNANLLICEKPGLMFSRICNMARFQHRAGKLDLIVIDYIGLIVGDPSKTIQNRNQELGAISRGLKGLAKELDVPVVALAQLNRGIEGRTDPKPKMSDLRDSGEIEQDADVIIMAHRDMQSDRGKMGTTEIEVPKVRHAKPGFCLLQFEGALSKFTDCADNLQNDDFQIAQKAMSAAEMMRPKKNPEDSGLRGTY